MTELPVGVALSLGLRALAREAWLAAVGLVVALVRRALTWPALAVAGLLLFQGAVTAARAAPLSPQLPLLGAAWVALQPRTVALVLGLWLAGALLSFALRLAWLAGALPTLAAALGPAPDPTPRFADGVAHVTPRLVPLALLTLAMELAGSGFSAALGLGALRLVVGTAGSGPAWLAAPVALALVLALLVPLVLSVVADAALVRAAVCGEGPLTAMASAAERFVSRPSALLATSLLVGLATVVAVLAVGAMGQAATGFVGPERSLLMVGPHLMLSALGLTVAAAIELWWLASLTALTTHTA